MRFPKVIAHRGYQRQFPENTMSAIRGAVDCGAKYFEIDVQLTADRVPILLHDDNLLRMCGSDQTVHQTCVSDLEQYAAAESSRLGDRFLHEPVATLNDCGGFLASHPHVSAFVELKTAATLQFTTQIVVESVLTALSDVLRQCVFISFSTELLREVQRQSQVAIGPVISDWGERSVIGCFERLPQILFCDIKGLPADGDLKLDNIELAVFEVPDAQAALKLAGRGVDYVETFAVCEVLREIETLSRQAT